MASWEINKGVGRTVEFRGLKAQYLFLFAGGLLSTFIVVVVLYLLGISQLVCLGIGVLGATLVVWQTFAMNRKYGICRTAVPSTTCFVTSNHKRQDEKQQ
ncbi:hypothetical protein HR15_10905 [Porphyromonas gulae]|uniref:Conjugal transfer protein TraF n=1 Tax=Porphyromonas gulae TaxID=111105 RepID=A0A0A2F373_9PORP|nr:hypothetical protein HR15_10905 [Porphyromonas gulae]